MLKSRAGSANPPCVSKYNDTRRQTSLRTTLGLEDKSPERLFWKLRDRIPKSEFEVPDKRASQPASREVLFEIENRVVLLQRQSSRSVGLEPVPDLFLPT